MTLLFVVQFAGGNLRLIRARAEKEVMSKQLNGITDPYQVLTYFTLLTNLPTFTCSVCCFVTKYRQQKIRS